MDQIAAKVYFYLALSFERLGRLQELQPYVTHPPVSRNIDTWLTLQSPSRCPSDCVSEK